MKKILLAVLVLIGLQTQAQINYCDSISYTTTSSTNFPFGVEGSLTFNGADTITWSWSVCNSTMCYSGVGWQCGFGQVSLTDTLKVCYDVNITVNNVTWLCSACDSVIWNGNQWMLMNMSNPTGINELQYTWEDDNKIYDMLGRELKEIPVGIMYIRNNKKHIKIK